MKLNNKLSRIFGTDDWEKTMLHPMHIVGPLLCLKELQVFDDDQVVVYRQFDRVSLRFHFTGKVSALKEELIRRDLLNPSSPDGYSAQIFVLNPEWEVEESCGEIPKLVIDDWSLIQDKTAIKVKAAVSDKLNEEEEGDDDYHFGMLAANFIEDLVGIPDDADIFFEKITHDVDRVCEEPEIIRIRLTASELRNSLKDSQDAEGYVGELVNLPNNQKFSIGGVNRHDYYFEYKITKIT